MGKPRLLPTMNVFKDMLRSAIESASSNTRIGFLKLEDRSRLLYEILLGHPPVNGGNRPRDYPMGLIHKKALETAGALAEKKNKVKIGNATYEYRLSDLFAAGDLLRMEAAENLSTTEREDFHWETIRLVLEELDGAFEYEHSQGNLARELQSALVVSPEYAWPSGERKNLRKLAKGVIDRAKEAGAIAMLSLQGGERDEGMEARRERLSGSDETEEGRRSPLGKATDRLSEKKFVVAEVKAKGVQAFLDRCELPYLRRGASAWCSRTTALLRNRARDWMGGEVATLTDSNAVLRLAMPAGDTGTEVTEGALAAQAKKFLEGSVSTKGESTALDDAYPMLRPWREQALEELPAAKAMDLFPDLDVRVRVRSLLELCLDAEAYSTKKSGSRPPNVKFSIPIEEKVKDPCFGRKGDEAFRKKAFVFPPNYVPKGRKDERYGWAAAAFGLAGKTYRTTVESALWEELEDPERSVKRGLSPSRTLKEMGAEGGLVLLKLDGDRVGRFFIESPSLSRSALSMHLERNVRERYVNAVKRLVAKRELQVLPVELIYFGGDDLECSMPAAFAEDFLTAFAEAPEETPPYPECLRDLTFSAAGILYESEDSRDDYATVAQRLLNPLLKDMAKPEKNTGKRRGGVELPLPATYEHEDFPRLDDLRVFAPSSALSAVFSDLRLPKTD